MRKVTTSLILLLILVLLPNGLLSPQAQAPRQIAFTSFPGETSGLYLMNEDGSALRRVLPEAVTAPQWSPDGSLLAFPTSEGLFVINADGSDKRQVSDAVSVDTFAWSPDGKRIAFSLNLQLGVFIVPISGGRVRQLGEGRLVAWLAKTDKILYERFRELYWKSPDGSDTEQASGEFVASNPQLSPDGNQIVGLMPAPDGNRTLILMGRVGLTLIENRQIGESLVWTSDSQQVIFSMQDDNRVFQIYSIRPANRELRQLTTGEGNKAHPTVTPDSAHVLFQTSGNSNEAGFAAAILTKQQVIEHYLSETTASSEAYSAIAYRSPGGDFLFWIIRSDGKTYIGDPTKDTLEEIAPTDTSMGERDTNGIPNALGLFARLKTDVLKYAPLLQKIVLRNGSETLKITSASLSGVLKVQVVVSRYRYDVAADTLTDTRTGDIYRAERNTFVTGEGATHKELGLRFRSDGDNEIYVMDLDGGNVRRLTSDGIPKFYPVMQPGK